MPLSPNLRHAIIYVSYDSITLELGVTRVLLCMQLLLHLDVYTKHGSYKFVSKVLLISIADFLSKWKWNKKQWMRHFSFSWVKCLIMSVINVWFHPSNIQTLWNINDSSMIFNKLDLFVKTHINAGHLPILFPLFIINTLHLLRSHGCIYHLADRTNWDI